MTTYNQAKSNSRNTSDINNPTRKVGVIHFLVLIISVVKATEIIKTGIARSLITIPSFSGNDSNLLIVFYVQIMPDDLVMQLHR
ncbi:hypothetical protein N6O22_25180, partial [Escherichia coli]